MRLLLLQPAPVAIRRLVASTAAAEATQQPKEVYECAPIQFQRIFRLGDRVLVMSGNAVTAGKFYALFGG